MACLLWHIELQQLSAVPMHKKHIFITLKGENARLTQIPSWIKFQMHLAKVQIVIPTFWFLWELNLSAIEFHFLFLEKFFFNSTVRIKICKWTHKFRKNLSRKKLDYIGSKP